MYLAIHLEVAKGRFLSSLIPQCVYDPAYKKDLYDNNERINYGIIHHNPEIRDSWEKIIKPVTKMTLKKKSKEERLNSKKVGAQQEQMGGGAAQKKKERDL